MKILYVFLVFITLTGLSSCVPYEHLVNFNEGTAFENRSGENFQVPELIVQTDDILQINVQSWDTQAAAPFNVSAELKSSGYQNSNSNSGGYLVNNNGEINFPVLGVINVEGLTTKAIRDTLINRLKPYLKDPSVNVRVLNFKISLLGEVKNPGTIVLQEEQVTILEVLSQVGDLTPYANRSNILVIREKEGQRYYGRLDLHATEVFNSPYFYLQQNDVVYVEPIKEKAATINTQASKILPWATVVVTLATLIVSVTR
ncbi:MAG: polysaccharide biosynthesis/export family protein [Saprospiraceae bacterium]|nr:polysaccharide biosynthesis/export family protein [Saprospiraceae bacterium]MCB9322704.1 polysaccharide biosynthesis/export family protein [Lewinellaceae bacterium]